MIDILALSDRNFYAWISSAGSKIIRVFDEEHQLIFERQLPCQSVRSITISCDGVIAVGLHQPYEVRLFATTSSDDMQVIGLKAQRPFCVAFNTEGTMLAVGSSEGLLILIISELMNK